MNETVPFWEMLTHGFRALVRRPVHAVILIVIASAAMIAYYTWVQSPGGLAWMRSYMDATAALSQGELMPFLSALIIPILAGIGIAMIAYSGAYRFLVREKSKIWLPFQIGADELRVLGVTVGVTLLVLAISAGYLLILGLIGLIIGLFIDLFIEGVSNGAGGIVDLFVAVTGIILFIPALVGLIYVTGRVSVSYPLSIKEKRLTLGGWKASKGQGWALLGAHLVLFVVSTIIQFFLVGDMMMASFEMGAGGTGLSDDQLALMANPYGDGLYIAAPAYIVILIAMLGPTAAVAAKAEEAQASGSVS